MVRGFLTFDGLAEVACCHALLELVHPCLDALLVRGKLLRNRVNRRFSLQFAKFDQLLAQSVTGVPLLFQFRRLWGLRHPLRHFVVAGGEHSLNACHRLVDSCGRQFDALLIRHAFASEQLQPLSFNLVLQCLFLRHQG